MRSAVLAALAFLAGCPGPKHPTPLNAEVGDVTVEVGRSGSTLRGAAGDDQQLYAALTEVAPGTGVRRTAIEARPIGGDGIAWRTIVSASGGPLARTSSLVVAALAGGEPEVRGEPGALAMGLDPQSGAIQWTVPFGATDWSVITSLAATDDNKVIVGGTFSGTLRVGDAVVSAGGNSDGFVCALDAAGKVAWLIRLGGPGPDSVQGVATHDERIAIAGTFVAGADFQGALLPAFDERLPYSDVFVGEVDANGKRVWSNTFGGKGEDSASGVAIDSRGNVAVAGTARGREMIDGVAHDTGDHANGLVAWFTKAGSPGSVQLMGGSDATGLRAVVAAGDGVVVAGFYTGTMKLGDVTFDGAGGDGAFLAAVIPAGFAQGWDLAGQGREDIAALAPIAGTDAFVVGVAHTADLQVGAAKLPALADPLAGAALVVRAAPVATAP